MVHIIHLLMRISDRVAQWRSGQECAAGDRKGTPEARAKSMNTHKNLMRNRRMLSVLRRL